MLFDYHLHSKYSFDGTQPPLEIVKQASKIGLKEICFTDHLDLDESREICALTDIASYVKTIRELGQERFGVRIKLGIEIALQNEEVFQESWNMIAPYHLDFIIGSIHNTIDGDSYEPAFFEGRTKQQVYAGYIQEVAQRCMTADRYNILGHFDYVAKHPPYQDRALCYHHNPDAFDCIFQYLIQHGLGLELNTSVYGTEKEPMWGLDIFKRYAELGGEFATIGSDAHILPRIGWRNEDALALLRAAGIQYIATYDQLKPTMHRIL